MHESQSVRLHALVYGQVQGVGFRAFVVTIAQVLGLTGWVRNTYTGQVEVVAEGSRPALERMVESLQKGPRSSYVEEVQAEWQEARGEFPEFYIARTI